MIRGLHHMAINTANMDRLIKFYVDVVGFELVSETEWQDAPAIDAIVGLKSSAAKTAFLKAGNCCIEVFQYSAPKARDAEPLRACDRGYTHLCLDMVGIEKEYERMKKAGMRFFGPPVDFGASKAIYGQDPDGNIIEILEIVDASLPYHPSKLRTLADVRAAAE